jgi:PAS domain S-box-containing protein
MHDHAVVIADTTGTIQFWSEGAQKLFGHSASHAVGQRLDLIVPEKYRDLHWAGFRRAMETGTAAAEGTPTDIPVQCHDGRVTAFHGYFMLLRDPQKAVIGAMAIFAAPTPVTGDES